MYLPEPGLTRPQHVVSASHLVHLFSFLIGVQPLMAAVRQPREAAIPVASFAFSGMNDYDHEHTSPYPIE